MKRILGICNPLLDLVAIVDNYFFEKYKITKSVTAIYEDGIHNGIYDEISKIPTCRKKPGGSTQNSIRIAQALCDSKMQCAYLGGIGNDEHGRILKELMATNGVQCVYNESNELATGVCACCVDLDTRDRAMITQLSAASLCPSDFIRKHWDMIDKADIIFSAGYFASTNSRMMLNVAEYCAANDKLWGVCLSAPFIINEFKSDIPKWIANANLVVGNELEWVELGKAFGMKSTDLRDIISECCFEWPWSSSSKGRSRYVIVTQGSKPTIVAYRTGNLADGFRVDEFPVMPIPKELVVDSAGCGDAFIGGFLYAWSHSHPLEKCIECAHLCAGEILQNDGVEFDLAFMKGKF